MEQKSIVFFFIFLFSSIITFIYLMKNKKKVLAYAYLALSLVLSLYTPILFGGRIFMKIILPGLNEHTGNIFISVLTKQLSSIIPFFNISFLISVSLSIILCFSLYIITLYIVKTLKRCFARGKQLKFAIPSVQKINLIEFLWAEYNLIFKNCRYNS